MKALVLCAGFGTRLGSLTRETPKALLPIAGEPLLAHTLRYLAAYGFCDVAVNLHHQGEHIRGRFGDGGAFGVRLTYAPEEALLGTAGAVKNLEPYFSDVEDFLVLYGDLLIDQDLTGLLAFHRKRRALATLLVHRRPGSNSVLEMDPMGRITRFLERPGAAERRQVADSWVNSGMQVLSRRVLAIIPPGRPADLPRDVYVPFLRDEPIYGYPLTGYRCAIDSPQRYAEAQAAVAEGRYRPPPPVQPANKPKAATAW